MSSVVVRHLKKSFGDVSVVDDISFSVNEGEILVIVGASGCGKTTTLRCIAGLEQATSGVIEIDGHVVASDTVFVPPERRGVGMMFQSYALWPNKSVFANVAYGLVLRRRPKAEIQEEVHRALSNVGLAQLAERFPSMLSGGQQQRVALARAAVVKPKVLLLDEPLSNLDAKLREQMRVELRELVKSLRMTAIHITHDQTEAMAIADKVIYMREGKIEQQGSPRDLYNRPVSRAVAEFVGSATFFEGRVLPGQNPAEAKIHISDVFELTAGASLTRPGDHEVTVALRPESIILTSALPRGQNVFAATIRSEVYLGDATEYIIEVRDLTLKCRSRAVYAVGEKVFAQIDPRDVICLPR